MRLIAGTAGGIPIKVPKTVTRPTTDRARQAMFSMLGEAVIGARALDLFAGSGALGLEALSRGAESALLVEQNRQAVEIIRDNMAKTRLQGGQVRQAEAFQFLKSLAASGEQFDLVFADPPYANDKGGDDLAAKLAASDDLRAIVRPGGHFVLECRVTKGGCASWSGWHTERDREHGSTRIVWLRKPDDETNEPRSL